MLDGSLDDPNLNIWDAFLPIDYNKLKNYISIQINNRFLVDKETTFV